MNNEQIIEQIRQLALSHQNSQHQDSYGFDERNDAFMDGQEWMADEILAILGEG